MATLCVAHTKPYSSATTCCCLLCRLPTARSCVPRPVRTPLHGSKLSQAIPTPRSPLKQCRSRRAAGSGSNSRSHPAAAGALRDLVAAAVRMLLEIMHLHALAPASWQGGANLLSEPGARLLAKPWGLRDTNPPLLLLHRSNMLPMPRPKHSFHCRQCCPGSHGVSRPPARRNLQTGRLP